MPFKSAKQMVYLQKNHPKVYKKWVEKYGEKVSKVSSQDRVQALKEMKV